MSSLAWELTFPEKRQSTLGRKKPCVTLSLTSDAGGIERFSIPVSVGRKVQSLEREGAFHPDSRAEFMYELTRIQESLIRSRIETLICRRDYSSYALREKLRLDGYFSSVVKESVERAVEVGLVDDARYADSYVRAKVSQGWGAIRIERELERKGLSTSLLEGWPQSYLSVASQKEKALSLARRKRLTGKNDYERIVRFLASKGYSFELCSSAAKQVLAESAQAKT